MHGSWFLEYTGFDSMEKHNFDRYPRRLVALDVPAAGGAEFFGKARELAAAAAREAFAKLERGTDDRGQEFPREPALAYMEPLE